MVASYADPSQAREVLGWAAHRGLDEMCADAWRWQSRNPRGYAEEKVAAAEVASQTALAS